MIGKHLGHYEILEKIGEGGMGEVYRAHDTKLDRDVAIKTLSGAVARSDERLARFQREAKAIAALNHPNIVTIYSVEEIDEVLFLSMELIEGETLSRLIGKDGLPLDKFFELAIALADALAAAHSQGVTHRDIKPSNIIVGKDGRLKVLDFGLAKLRGLTADSSQIMELPTVAAEEPVTAKGEVLGTAMYMSPEQAEGKALDHRSDIFSLGVVLYEMATGARPFHGDTPASLISSILRDDPPSISEMNRRLPRHLGRIVKRCLAKDVQRRFQTALDVRNELAGLKGEWESGELGDLVSPVESRRRGRRRTWGFAGPRPWLSSSSHSPWSGSVVIAGHPVRDLCRTSSSPDSPTSLVLKGNPVSRPAANSSPSSTGHRIAVTSTCSVWAGNGRSTSHRIFPDRIGSRHSRPTVPGLPSVLNAMAVVSTSWEPPANRRGAFWTLAIGHLGPPMARSSPIAWRRSPTRAPCPRPARSGE